MNEAPQRVVEYVPADAPFSDEQRAWLNGFIAGLCAEATAAPAPRKDQPALRILYGSQTGTAEALARSFAREAKQRGFNVTVNGMEETSLATLAQSDRVLVLCSTHGEGDPPDNAADLFAALQSAGAPHLEHLAYSVLALGDANYEQFCGCGRAIDRRLAELGARRIFERVDCDVDVDEPFIRWRDGVLGALTAPSGSPAAVAPATQTERPARTLGSARRVASLARVVESRNLNAPGSEKETRHVVLRSAQPGPDLAYEPGDALAVLPFNAPAMVVEIMEVAGFEPESSIVDHGEPMTLATALTERFAINRLNAPTLRKFAEHTRHAGLLRLLEPEQHDELQAFLRGGELIDLLLAVPRAFRAPDELLAILPRLAPRLYSIASSPRAHPGEVHLTVSAVRYHAHGRERKGVCSTFLAERAAPGTPLLVYIQENRRFRLPEDASVPAIMIGPGTGIAPFRAFLHERLHAGASGKNWLFFGDRRAATDFLYADELAVLQEQGTLTRLDTAFSRDQGEKVYVQERMREHARELWQWLDAGAHLYVCGDATHMARDVEAALTEIVAAEGRFSRETALEFVHALRKTNRYQRDVY